MNALEFLVEFTKAYGTILVHLWWPIVVLVIFFSLLYYFDRSLGSFGRRRRFPLSWKNVNQMVKQLENHYLNAITPDGNHHPREMLVHEQIQRAKRGVEQRDEQEVVKALMALSSLGVHHDDQLPQQLPADPAHWIEEGADKNEVDKK
ncbi:MAG: hypothetical protein JXR73_06145 [Candidatus Omnitrophica bacterium]|nr:hypothetical protein [Candidatus Omnitrophota bacterium]